MSTNYELAYTGLGKALYNEGDFAGAMKYYTVSYTHLNFTSEFLDGFFKQGDAEVRILDFVYQQPMLPPDIRFSNKLRLGEEEIEEVVALSLIHISRDWSRK